MENQFIPKALLEKSNKILFIGSIAIGDFTYLQACFKSLACAYPNLKIDLWLDEYRGKSSLLRWGNKGHDIVYDWIESSSLFNKVFKNVGGWWNLPRFFKQLRQKNYPIVVCLFNRRCSMSFAKKISPNGFIIETVETFCDMPVAQAFANNFTQLFDIKVLNWQKPAAFIIDKHILEATQIRLRQWGIKNDTKIIFINAFAKNIKRCWPIENVIELIKRLQADGIFGDANFIVNSLPNKKILLEKLIEKNTLRNVHVFTVEHSFYELPAMISLSDLVVSVDTSVVHLAYAQKVPVVALMRQKNAHWAPSGAITVFTKSRSDWADKIVVQDVLEKIKTVNF